MFCSFELENPTLLQFLSFISHTVLITLQFSFPFCMCLCMPFFPTTTCNSLSFLLFLLLLLLPCWLLYCIMLPCKASSGPDRSCPQLVGQSSSRSASPRKLRPAPGGGADGEMTTMAVAPQRLRPSGQPQRLGVSIGDVKRMFWEAQQLKKRVADEGAARQRTRQQQQREKEEDDNDEERERLPSQEQPQHGEKVEVEVNVAAPNMAGKCRELREAAVSALARAAFEGLPERDAGESTEESEEEGGETANGSDDACQKGKKKRRMCTHLTPKWSQKHSSDSDESPPHFSVGRERARQGRSTSSEASSLKSRQTPDPFDPSGKSGPAPTILADAKFHRVVRFSTPNPVSSQVPSEGGSHSSSRQRKFSRPSTPVVDSLASNRSIGGLDRVMSMLNERAHKLAQAKKNARLAAGSCAKPLFSATVTVDSTTPSRCAPEREHSSSATAPSSSTSGPSQLANVRSIKADVPSSASPARTAPAPPEDPFEKDKKLMATLISAIALFFPPNCTDYYHEINGMAKDQQQRLVKLVKSYQLLHQQLAGHNVKGPLLGASLVKAVEAWTEQNACVMVSLLPSLTTVSPLACDSPRPPSLSPQQRPSHSSILTASEVRMPHIKAKRAARPKPPPLVLSTEPLHRENKSHNGNDARALAVQVANTSAPASTTKSASVGGPPPSSPAPRHTKAAPPQRNATDPKRKKAKAAGRPAVSPGATEGKKQVRQLSNAHVATPTKTPKESKKQKKHKKGDLASFGCIASSSNDNVAAKKEGRKSTSKSRVQSAPKCVLTAPAEAGTCAYAAPTTTPLLVHTQPAAAPSPSAALPPASESASPERLRRKTYEVVAIRGSFCVNLAQGSKTMVFHSEVPQQQKQGKMSGVMAEAPENATSATLSVTVSPAGTATTLAALPPIPPPPPPIILAQKPPTAVFPSPARSSMCAAGGSANALTCSGSFSAFSDDALQVSENALSSCRQSDPEALQAQRNSALCLLSLCKRTQGHKGQRALERHNGSRTSFLRRAFSRGVALPYMLFNTSGETLYSGGHDVDKAVESARQSNSGHPCGESEEQSMHAVPSFFFSPRSPPVISPVESNMNTSLLGDAVEGSAFAGFSEKSPAQSAMSSLESKLIIDLKHNQWSDSYSSTPETIAIDHDNPIYTAPSDIDWQR